MKNLVLRVIRAYQRNISSASGGKCRFLPTCSAYAYEAVERFGAFRGLYLGLRRVLRCHPLTKPGYDPVPEVFSWRRQKPKSS